jgi:hypothetical protein
MKRRRLSQPVCADDAAVWSVNAAPRVSILAFSAHSTLSLFPLRASPVALPTRRCAVKSPHILTIRLQQPVPAPFSIIAASKTNKGLGTC